ncbi:peptidase family M48-domain-containing protein [Apodospora peruviana]|uniref:Peptidase family M48-domain-containing protein n=1 Tax=Apodospora peruviana TaxID=516989 RepID=A0AAE0IJD1_9PEZI|nr:peptidase family M48-domain-containing protein [Apodospora peruviana]
MMSSKLLLPRLTGPRAGATKRLLQPAIARRTLASPRSVRSDAAASPKQSLRVPPQNTFPRQSQWQWQWRRSQNSQRPPNQQQQQQRRTYHFRPSQYDPDGSRLRDAQPLLTTTSLGRVARSPRTHTIAVLAVAGAFIFYFSNLETVPVSGRTRFNVYSRATVRSMGDMQYKMMLYELERAGTHVLSDWDPRTVRVKRVMKKLIPFSGMTDEEWEIYVVDAPQTANALVIPGGKVFVFSGILNIARSDSALAAVLGHEIAHNVADHVGERLSSSIGTNILLYSVMLIAGGIGLGPLLAHYLGSRFLAVAFDNPMSRRQETEADYIGLMMMAEACYDPSEAVRFWARMDQAGGDQPPEWISTHPSNENRIKKIQEWLPKALEKRAESDCRSTTAFADLFRRALDTGVVLVYE